MRQMGKTTQKKIKIAARIREDLYDMVCEIAALYDGNWTKALETILEDYRYSTPHLDKLKKLERLRDLLIKLESNR